MNILLHLTAEQTGRGYSTTRSVPALRYQRTKYAFIDRDRYAPYPEGDSLFPDTAFGCWAPVEVMETGVHAVSGDPLGVHRGTEGHPLGRALSFVASHGHDAEALSEYLNDFEDEGEFREIVRQITNISGPRPEDHDNPFASLVGELTFQDPRNVITPDTSEHLVFTHCVLWRRDHLPPEIDRDDADQVSRFVLADMRKAGCITDDSVRKAVLDMLEPQPDLGHSFRPG